MANSVLKTIETHIMVWKIIKEKQGEDDFVNGAIEALKVLKNHIGDKV